MTQVFLTTASTSPWAVPANFNVPGHTVELMGCGGNGGAGGTGTNSLAGGGGASGLYAKFVYSSGTITPGTTTIQFFVAAGGTTSTSGSTTPQAGTTTWESGSVNGANSYSVSGGNNASTSTGGTGTPQVYTNSTPGITYTFTATGSSGGGSGAKNGGGGGGGGAGGPSTTGGFGNNGNTSFTGGAGGGGANSSLSSANGAAPTSASGASGGQGSTGTPGSTGGAAGTGTSGGAGGTGSSTAGANTAGGNGGAGGITPFLWDSTHDSGGGGGGGGANSATTGTPTTSGGNGANFGGGGGGGGRTGASSGTLSGGTGGNGLIVITSGAVVEVLLDRTYGARNFVPTAHTILRDYRQNRALDGQRETNPHFIGRHAATVLPNRPALRQLPANDLPPQVATYSSIFVVSFDDGYVDAALIARRHYQGSAADVTPAAPQPETNTHFRGRFTAPVHARFNYQLGTPDVPPADATANLFVVLDPAQPPRVQARRLYYQAPAGDVPTVVAQPETNTNFLGRFSAPVHARFNYNRSDQDPTQVATYSSIFTISFDDGWLGTPSIAALYQQPARDVPTVVQPETNTHFLGRFTAPAHSRLPLLVQNQDTTSASSFPTAVTNVHFLGRFTAPVHRISPLLRHQGSALDVRPEQNPHFVGRFAPMGHAILRGLRETTTLSADTQRETNQHFLGRHTPTVHQINRPAIQNSAADIVAAPVVETNPHFLGRYTAPVHARLKYLGSSLDVPPADATANLLVFLDPPQPPRVQAAKLYYQSPANDVPVQVSQPETNTSFLGRFTATAHARFNYNTITAEPPNPPNYSSTLVVSFDDGWLGTPKIAATYQRPANDIPPVVVAPDAPPSFLGAFEGYTTSLLASLRQNSSDLVIVQPETNPHFIARFTPTTIATLPLLRQNPATDFVVAAPVPSSANIFVVGFDNPWLDASRIAQLYMLPATDFIVQVAQPETQPHFLGRFTPAKHQVQPGARQNSATDIQRPEQNPHFIGRHVAPVHARFNYQKQNEFAVAVVETNVHFLGRFAPPAITILPALRQTTLSADTQRETNPHFIGRHTPARHAINQAARQTPALDIQPETNPHFVGRFAPTNHTINRAAFQNAAVDFVIAPQVEAQPHFIGRYKAPIHARFAYNVWDTAVPQRETNPHTIGRFTPTKITVLPALRQAPALDVPRAEQNPHFLGRFTPPTHQVLRSLLGNLGDRAIIVPDSGANPHFIGRHTPTAHARSIYHLASADVTVPAHVAEAKSILNAFVASTALAGESATSTLAGYRATSELDRNR